jgi:uncharacterized protein (TIGR02271 family)
MARVASAVFDDRRDAERAVSMLRSRGVPDDAISVISRHEEGAGNARDTTRDAGQGAADAGKGLGTGLGVGAGVGALFGLAAALIPGIGPLIAAGPLAAALGATGGAVVSGAIVGGTSGANAGALSHWGLNETEARHYAGEIERGGTYVGVDLDRANMDRDEVLGIFRSCGGRTAGAEGTYTGGPEASRATADTRQEMRVPLREERPELHREMRQTGEVNVTKRVETETQHISEPVTREHVSVDVRPVAQGTPVDPDTTLRPGQTVRVPVHEEELVVGKQAQVTGEAVISKHAQTRQVEKDIPLRKERVAVDAVGDADVDADEDVVRGRSTA